MDINQLELYSVSSKLTEYQTLLLVFEVDQLTRAALVSLSRFDKNQDNKLWSHSLEQNIFEALGYIL